MYSPLTSAKACSTKLIVALAKGVRHTVCAITVLEAPVIEVETHYFIVLKSLGLTNAI
jgi:hypothetical protein